MMPHWMLSSNSDQKSEYAIAKTYDDQWIWSRPELATFEEVNAWSGKWQFSAKEHTNKGIHFCCLEDTYDITSEHFDKRYQLNTPRSYKVDRPHHIVTQAGCSRFKRRFRNSITNFRVSCYFDSWFAQAVSWSASSSTHNWYVSPNSLFSVLWRFLWRRSSGYSGS